jgi:DNA-binding NarL/FixJ family response regulator
LSCVCLWPGARRVRPAVGERIGVLIVDDHVVIAEGLSVLIAADSDLAVVGVAHTAAHGLRLAAARGPRVVLLDHYLPDQTGVALTAQLKAVLPGTAVVILTSQDDDEILAGAFEAGASGFLLKTQAAEHVIDAIKTAAAGEMLVTGATLTRVLRHRQSRASAPAKPIDLTERERDVLRLLAEGLDSRAIAEEFGLTVATVRTYVQTILRKFGAHSRLQAVMRAQRQGLL